MADLDSLKELAEEHLERELKIARKILELQVIRGRNISSGFTATVLSRKH